MNLDGVRLRRSPTQTRSRDKVERALAAAERVLDRDGADALTITAVAAEADLPVGTLHQYLPDREAITAALADLYHARLETALDEVLAADRAGSLDDPVATTVNAMCEVFRATSGVRALRGGQRDEASAEHRQRMTTKVGELLGADGRAAPEAVARTVFVAVDALLRDAFAVHADGDAELIEQTVVLVRGYVVGARRG
ncbi:TetR family transcriptional regulator [Cellulomonas citrea]|uniref:TetR family transcriptional regulator n=1 Tax=Cellulomonas citrea TaxID=1909423 RepID=UPI001357B955|nr:TetR family transcriptional regulator [Cellulomonas citrea]